MGAILGFLPYNLHPARVFLGDAGSLTIGFALASTAALTATKAPTAVGLLVPLVGLGIPILDTLFAMVRRMIERRSILSADKSHLHHRLMAKGFGQPRTVFLLCTVAALCVIGTTAATPTSNLDRLLLAGLALLAYTTIFRMTGAIRFRESFAAVGAMASGARAASDEAQSVDRATLGLSDAKDVDTWWQAITRTGESLRFREMELEPSNENGGGCVLHWVATDAPVQMTQREHADTTADDDQSLATFVIPVPEQRGEAVRGTLRVAVDASPSIEQVARRLRVFCRIIERNRSTSNLDNDRATTTIADSEDVALTV